MHMPVQQDTASKQDSRQDAPQRRRRGAAAVNLPSNGSRLRQSGRVLFLVLMVVLGVAVGLVAVLRKQRSPVDVPAPTELVVGIDTEPERLDPLTIKSPRTFIVSWQIYEGLFGLDQRGQITPIVAESWTTDDYQTWRVVLRKDVRFHPSPLFGSPTATRPVDSADVVASYTEFCSARAYPTFILTDSLRGCAEYNQGKAAAVDGITAVDEHTVEFRLLKPEPFFLNRLTTAWIAIFPREVLDPKYSDSWGLEFAIGTGPYRLVRRSETEVVLDSNVDYWDAASQPQVPKLVFRVIKSDSIRLAELKKGRIDMMILPPLLYPSALAAEGELKRELKDGFASVNFSTFNTHMIGFNLTRVPDVHLRRAMNFAVNRQDIRQTLLYGHADMTSGPVPPGMNSFLPNTDPASLYDPAAARRELALSSYKGEPLEMLVHQLANSEQIGQLFQSQMKAIGINIQLTKVDFNSAIARIIKGDSPLFSMFFDYVVSSPEPILIDLFSASKRPVPNVFQLAVPSVDAELEALRFAPPGTSIRRCAVIEDEIMALVPGIFLYRQREVVLLSKRFAGLSINPHGHFLLSAVAPSH
jgi:ABC-type transport system substrate-binding protein